MEQIDVVILGAGLAGLTAARRLRKAGLAVEVLEARERSGGRAYSPEVSGHRLDLGATWVWDTERSIHGLLVELGIETFAHRDEGLDTLDGAELQRGRFPRSSLPERRIVGGVQSITDALAEGVAIRFGTEALSLGVDGEGVRVVTRTGEHHARRVLAAFPPSLVSRLLPAGEEADLLGRVPVWMGDVAKVVATFRSRFWRTAGWSGQGASRRGPMVEIHDMSGRDGRPACLFGFVPREAGGADLEGRVRDQFLRMFGPAAVPVSVRIQAWWDEPFTTEAEPHADHRLFGHEVLRKPLMDGRLHLISCETSGVSPGHLNGAVERANTVCASVLVDSNSG